MAMGGNRLLAERAAPADGEARGAGRGSRVRSVTVNLAESPLGWLLARGHLTTAQFDAGEMLRADFERAQLAPRVTMAWDPVRTTRPPSGGRGLGPTLSQVSARRRFDEAIAAAGPGLADILWRIVCAGEAMREAEGALGWPARGGRLVLTLALDRLAHFYRLTSPPEGAGRSE